MVAVPEIDEREYEDSTGRDGDHTTGDAFGGASARLRINSADVAGGGGGGGGGDTSATNRARMSPQLSVAHPMSEDIKMEFHSMSRSSSSSQYYGG